MNLAVLAAALAFAPPPARVVGHVLNREDAAATVAGVRVVLHRVGRLAQGPVDTTVTDAAGRFVFQYAFDSTASYLVSARYAGIEYFSPPIAARPARPDTALRLVVYDTSSAAPVATKSRTLVVGSADAVGARTIIDWLVIDNRGAITRVGRDSTRPSWGAAMPREARNPVVGDARLSQISPEAVDFRADSIFVLAPISPGPKEVLVQYEIPGSARRFMLPVAGIDSVDVFLEERGARVEGPGWIARDSQLFEGRRFTRYVSAGPPPAMVTVVLPGAPDLPGYVLPTLVALMGVGLAGAAWYRMRRPPAPTRPH